MNYTCRYCASVFPLTGNTLRCPICGAPIASVSAVPDLAISDIQDSKKVDPETLFSRSDWAKKWEAASGSRKKTGLILTDTTTLANGQDFSKALHRYIEYKCSVDQIHYYLLDLKTAFPADSIGDDDSAEDKLEKIVALLSQIYDHGIPDYLMIVGNHNVIPPVYIPRLDPEDPDEIIPSDFVYIALDLDTVNHGNTYRLKDITEVGRIPASPGDNFATAIAYFRHTIEAKQFGTPRAMMYSAEVWKRASLSVCHPFAKEIIFSPNYTVNPMMIFNDTCDALLGNTLDRYNFLCFNLHGSPALLLNWYGQRADMYPDAMDASSLPKGNAGGYVMCSEACYGAKPNIEAGILNTALRSGCHAFVGSTCVAYGACDSNLNCADLIAQNYCKALYNGETSGSAFLAALDFFFSHDLLTDLCSVKTVLEFGLYGDPSFSIAKNDSTKAAPAEKKRAEKIADPKGEIKMYALSDDGTPKDPLHAISNYSSTGQQVSIVPKALISRIGDRCSSFITSNYSCMENVAPSLYKLNGNRGFRSVYHAKRGQFTQTVILRMDEQGNVIASCESK